MQEQEYLMRVTALVMSCTTTVHMADDMMESLVAAKNRILAHREAALVVQEAALMVAFEDLGSWRSIVYPRLLQAESTPRIRPDVAAGLHPSDLVAIQNSDWHAHSPSLLTCIIDEREYEARQNPEDRQWTVEVVLDRDAPTRWGQGMPTTKTVHVGPLPEALAAVKTHAGLRC